MREFFGRWRADLPNARKYPMAVRDYMMAKITSVSRVQAELCGVRLGDVHWDLGQQGRFWWRARVPA
ncbi:hypothetical protein [Amycolatopsis sp. lyj-108]|uniref:hypothetical protein n=1 Tax=Amycolatopsis sp. lyj-108 TaxID=2789286 RepID=UPI00397922A3